MFSLLCTFSCIKALNDRICPKETIFQVLMILFQKRKSHISFLRCKHYICCILRSQFSCFCSTLPITVLCINNILAGLICFLFFFFFFWENIFFFFFFFFFWQGILKKIMFFLLFLYRCLLCFLG